MRRLQTMRPGVAKVRPLDIASRVSSITLLVIGWTISPRTLSNFCRSAFLTIKMTKNHLRRRSRVLQMILITMVSASDLGGKPHNQIPYLHCEIIWH